VKGEYALLGPSLCLTYVVPWKPSYRFMDVSMFSPLRGTRIKRIVISYDVACQWSAKFWSRHRQLPSVLQLDANNIILVFAIPKFHLLAHKISCHCRYNFNYLFGAGRTDGEGVERLWSPLNKAAHSTKEMGRGSRHDALDDQCNDSNYSRIRDLGAFCMHLLG
jgi:hypothetical protein